MEEEKSRSQKLILFADTDKIEAKVIGSFGKTKITLSQGRLMDARVSERVQNVEVYVEVNERAPSSIIPLGGHGVADIIWRGSVDDLGRIIAIGVAVTEYMKNVDGE